MEDDEDCYGFGALSDMFDDRSTSASISSTSTSNGVPAEPIVAPGRPVEQKRLDVAAMSRFWWSERRLQSFRRGAQRHTKEYHHIAAKFDGMRVDGGLGSLFLVPRGQSDDDTSDGGVLWIQAQASDSNAQARRKKEFQDITNRLPLVDVSRPDPLKTPKGSHKSTATVFLSMEEILDATETTMQHTVHGIKFMLLSGHHFEIAFMPGPFYDARNRDELLQAFQRQQIADVFAPSPPPPPPQDRSVPVTVREAPLPVSARSSPEPFPAAESSSLVRGRSSRSTSPNAPSSQPGSRTHTPHSSPGTLSPSGVSSAVDASEIVISPEDHRAWIRRYVQLDETSAEAIALAQKIHAATQYHAGPQATEFPQFSSDSVYRKKTVDALSRTLERMNQDWKMSEQERLLHTRASVTRDDNDVFQYTDTITFDMISATAYQQRYTEYVDAEQPEQPPVIRLFEPRLQSSGVHHEEEEPPTATATMDVPDACRDLPSAVVFGVDLHRSAVINASFLSSWKSMACPTDEDLCDWNDLVDKSVIAVAHESHAKSVLAIIHNLQQYVPSHTLPPEESRGGDSPPHQSERGKRCRSSSRRRSLDQPSLEDFRAEFVGSTESNGRTDRPSPSKRPRPSTGSDASPTATRRRRRQSLVGTLDMSLTEEKEETDVDLGAVQPMDTTCPLCCDADAVVVMNPCGHSVCRTCWGRLARAESTAAEEDGVDIRQCPWDREPVNQR